MTRKPIIAVCCTALLLLMAPAAAQTFPITIDATALSPQSTRIVCGASVFDFPQDTATSLSRRGLELVAAPRCPMDMPNDNRRAAAWIFETRLQYRPLRRRSLYLRDEPVVGLGEAVIQDEAAADNIDVGFILGLLVTARWDRFCPVSVSPTASVA